MPVSCSARWEKRRSPRPHSRRGLRQPPSTYRTSLYSPSISLRSGDYRRFTSAHHSEIERNWAGGERRPFPGFFPARGEVILTGPPALPQHNGSSLHVFFVCFLSAQSGPFGIGWTGRVGDLRAPLGVRFLAQAWARNRGPGGADVAVGLPWQ